MTRNLAVHGLEPCLGIFHHNERNQFNLADDLMEPAVNNRLMKISVFFDLPVKTKAERGAAAKFRNFLLMDGYHRHAEKTFS